MNNHNDAANLKFFSILNTLWDNMFFKGAVVSIKYFFKMSKYYFSEFQNYIKLRSFDIDVPHIVNSVDITLYDSSGSYFHSVELFKR